jgi:hypothetical protein
MMRPPPPLPPGGVGTLLSRVIVWLGVLFASLVTILIIGFILMSIMFYFETPPILRGATNRGGWDDGCPSDREGVLTVPLSRVALSPEFTERLTKAFPPGTSSTVVEQALTRQGFKIPVVHICTNDPNVRTAFFTLQTFGSFQGTAYWKVDAHGNVVWIRGIVSEYFLI